MKLHLSLPLALALLATGQSFSAPTIDYAAKIAPLFQEHCVDCHAADDADGDFVIETYEALMKGGETGQAIVPGNAQDSLLVKFLEGRSGKEGKNKFMPPGKREHLKPGEIAMIRQWIDAGAPAPVAERTLTDILRTLPKVAPKSVQPKAIHALAFSAKAKVIAAGSYGSVQLIDAASRRPLRSLAGAAGKVNALVFSSDGTMLFGAAGEPGVNGIACQWKVSDGSLVRKFEGHKDALYALALSPDGLTLATGSYDQKIKLWNVTDGTERRTISGHNGGVFGLSFRPDGAVLASASGDRTVKLWNTATGARLDTFSQPFKEQTAVAFAPDGRTVASAGVDNRIRTWSVSAKALEGSNPLTVSRYGHEGGILNLTYSADGRILVSAAADRTVKIWDAATLTEKHLLASQSDWSPALALLDGGLLAVGRLDGSLGYYDTATGKVAAAPVAAPAKKAAARPAMVAKPEILRLSPGGVQAGAITAVTLTGKNLGSLQQVKFNHPGLKATIVHVDPAGTSAELAIAADSTLRRAQVMCSVVTKSGESGQKKLPVDYLPQIVVRKSAAPTPLERLPINVWGTLTETGQQDNFRFAAKKGETVVFDVAARRIDSKAVRARLEIFNHRGKLLAANNGLDSGTDPFIAFTAPHDGDYVARIYEITLEGSADHAYRLTVGVLPYVTGWWPLSVPANRESTVQLTGHNLTTRTVTVKAGADGEVTLPLDTDEYRSRVAMRVMVSALPEALEQEPNDEAGKAQPLPLPASVNGRLHDQSTPDRADADMYRIEAEKGQKLVVETRAAMLGSPVDTKVEVLDAKGLPVPHLILQATRDSWITLRSEDANDPAIRLGQFDEMDLNDYMYFNGEVLRIFRLARGPDSDMSYFARGAMRRAWFFTSPAGHGLDEPCYVVVPHPVGATIVPNGLPTFTLHYTNDDDSERQLGRDSRLIFTAPEKGTYLVRVTDTRGWSGERFAYRLLVRPPQPDFTARIVTKGLEAIPAGSGVQIAVEVDRTDGFEGPIRVDLDGAPAGFLVSSPIVVEPGRLSAAGTVFAHASTPHGPADFSKMKLTVTAKIGTESITRTLPALGRIAVAPPLMQALFLEPDRDGKAEGDGKSAPQKPWEITLAPGGRVPAWLRVDRRGNDALLALDIEGLPHGVIIDSIGLNGVQVRANEAEREVFLSCAPWVEEQDRLCHLVTGNARGNEITEGLQTSFPVLLKIRKTPMAPATATR
jgi:WD40 repeat protein